MDFVVEFVRVFTMGLTYCAPLLGFLIAIIILLGLIVGRQENWSRSNAVYYAFITATTVGYGDFHPSHPKSRYLAIGIALVGLVFTGIIVAVGVHATENAFSVLYDLEEIKNAVKTTGRG